MTSRKPLLFAFAAAVLMGAGPASAQLDPLTDPLPRVLGDTAERRLDRVEQTLREMRTILFQGRDTGRPVVVQPAETQGQVNILDNRVVDLQQTLLNINSQLDSLAADIAALRREATQNAATLRDLTQADAAMRTRLDAIEKAAADRAAIAANPEAAFATAKALFDANQPVPATDAFRSFLSTNPDDARAPEARYYLGELLFRQASYTEAAQSYLAAIRGWPQTPWAPTAVVKLAQSLIEANRSPDACGVLAELSTRYPTIPAALQTEARAARTRARCA